MYYKLFMRAGNEMEFREPKMIDTSKDDWNDPIVRISRAERPPMPKLKLVVILTDGIRGHVNQSRGVAMWLSKYTGAEIMELEIPELMGVKKSKARMAASRLLGGNRRKARDWLAMAEGESVIRTVGRWLAERDIREGDASSLIILSAGSMPSFYNIALGYIWRCTCITLMTPSVIGTEPFDFAVVPEHDYPKDLTNIMTTVGAPNLIVREELGTVAQSLLREFPPVHDRRWGVIIGGDDKNYRITPAWIQRNVGRIFSEAERSGIDLYIATSRRTSLEAESALKRIAANCGMVRFVLYASEDPLNPVPAILGACDEIFATDDSINMVSEAATAGHRVVLLRTERVSLVRRFIHGLMSAIVSTGLLPKRFIWGPPRFDRTFDTFAKMGLLIEYRDWYVERRRDDLSPFAPLDEELDIDRDGFNEARRASEWILDHLGDVYHPSEDEQ